MSYSLRIKQSAVKALKKINKPDRVRILEAIGSLPELPHQGTQLKGGLTGLRRIRIGDYRVIYEVNDGELTILVVHLGHRKDVYR